MWKSPVLAKLLGRSEAAPLQSRPRLDLARVPEGSRVYAIGDVHGRVDLLNQLIDIILEDITEAMERDVSMVFLGDYVDRGPDARRVIETLRLLKQNAPTRVVVLKGNHEEALLAFLADPATGAAWMEHGGRETMLSYGVEAPAKRADNEAWLKARDAFEAALPANHINFLQSLKLSTLIGDYFFVHAGVRPGLSLDKQKERDLLWIRDDFLDDDHGLDQIVVHGHTMADHPEVTNNRIGIDTGAYATGILTALKLMGDARSFLQTTRS